MHSNLRRLGLAMLGLIGMILLASISVASGHTRASSAAVPVDSDREETSDQVEWGEFSGCDVRNNRSLDVTVTNSTSSTRQYRMVVANTVTGLQIHATLNQQIGAGVTRAFVLGGIPTGRWTFKVDQDGVDLSAGIDRTVQSCEAVAWGDWTDCDAREARGLVATVTNKSSIEHDFRMMVLNPITGAFVHGSEAHFIAAGATSEVDLEGIPAGRWEFRITRDGGDFEDSNPITVRRFACPGLVQSVHDHQIMHAVSCLGGNGRVDTNIVNGGRAAALYEISFQGLTPRQRTVQAGDWWRMPITGRPDGDFDVVVKRDGVNVSDQMVTVACDGGVVAVDDTEVRVVNACRAGNGYLLFQFVNPTAAQRSWVIEFEGVANRSTGTTAFGAGVRAVTGRQDGIHRAAIRVGSTTVAEFAVHVQCSDTIAMPVLALSFIEPLPGTNRWNQHRAIPILNNVFIPELEDHIAESEDVIVGALNAGARTDDGRQLLNYRVIDRVQFDEYPPYLEGDAYNGRQRPEYDTILEELLPNHPDFERPIGEGGGRYVDFCEYIDANDVKEVWIWTDHDDDIEPRESMMSSPRDRPRVDLSNSERSSDSLPHCEHTYVMYNFNFTREPVIHTHLHQVEAVYGRSNPNPIDREVFWFAGSDDDPLNEKGIRVNTDSFTFACGDAHWTPNRIRGIFGRIPPDPEEYRFGQLPEPLGVPVTRDTNCVDWDPNGSPATTLGCDAWSCDELEFYSWWLRRMPGPDSGLTYNGHPLRAWHHGIGDFDVIADELSFTVDLDEVAG